MELEPKCRKEINIIQWILIGLCALTLLILHKDLKDSYITIDKYRSNVTEYRFRQMYDSNTIRSLRLDNMALRDSVEILKSELSKQEPAKRKRQP